MRPYKASGKRLIIPANTGTTGKRRRRSKPGTETLNERTIAPYAQRTKERPAFAGRSHHRHCRRIAPRVELSR
ncbi:hypothetical protein [Lysobacter gummosus]|uniref:hypothetical protein n=1 Tax=Lysobacter gummosus TaxID=262324 RepID=UPI00363ECFC2